MVSISEITQQTTQTQETVKTNSATLGQEDFLTLLVAQLQNQDPLNPADATEFTAQLAQYSQLEQLFNLNDTMDQLATAQNNSQRVSALSLMGKEVVVEGSNFHMANDSAELGYKVTGIISEADMVIRDQYGKTVRQISLSEFAPGNHTITWDGKDYEGNQLEPGSYSISIQTPTDGDGDLKNTISPLVRAEVTGVNLEGAAPMLVTSSGEFGIESIHGAFDKNNQEAAPDEPEEGSDNGAVSSILEEEVNSAATDGADSVEGTTPEEQQPA